MWAVHHGKEDAVGGLPARSADLSLEHPELMSEREDLSLEPGLRPTADDQGLKEEVEDGVEEGESTVVG